MKRTHLLPAALLLINNLFAQTTDLVTPDPVTFPVHQEHIGTIAFMEKVVPIETFRASDFLQSFELKEKSDLNIRVFMGNSLTNYLHQLAPELSEEALVKNGNYQFTFLVDGKSVYQENLNTGAGSPDSKNQKTVFRVPLMSTSEEDSWGRFLWNRFMMSGGQEAFQPGEHLLKLEIRPYLKLTEMKVGQLIAAGELKVIVPEVKVDEKLIRIQAIKPQKEWELASGQVNQPKIEELNRKIANKIFKDLTSIVIIKDGKLLLEEYFNGSSRNALHDTRSVGKSFASTLLGMAIRDKYISNEEQHIDRFYNLGNYQNPSSAKDSVSLKNLLTMSSVFKGFDMDGSSPGNEENMYPTANWVDFTLNLPVDETKVAEKRWEYFTAGVVLLGDVIHKSVPGGLKNYADQNLFKPLGISNYQWQYTPQKVANTAGGLQLRSLDLAKYGQLYQNKGQWKGKQLLPADWVEKSFSHQAQVSEGEYYGYLFWNKTYTVGGKNYEVYYCSGNGGNKVVVFKDQPLVIVITAEAYNKPYAHSQVDKIIGDYLIPAVLD